MLIDNRKLNSQFSIFNYQLSINISIMGFNEFMTKLFGNKSQRDLKEITPYVDKV